MFYLMCILMEEMWNFVFFWCLLIIYCLIKMCIISILYVYYGFYLIKGIWISSWNLKKIRMNIYNILRLFIVMWFLKLIV